MPPILYTWLIIELQFAYIQPHTMWIFPYQLQTNSLPLSEHGEVHMLIDESRGDLHERSLLKSIALSMILRCYLKNLETYYVLDFLLILSPYQQHCDVLKAYLTHAYPHLNNVNTRCHRILRKCVGTVPLFKI